MRKPSNTITSYRYHIWTALLPTATTVGKQLPVYLPHCPLQLSKPDEITLCLATSSPDCH